MFIKNLILILYFCFLNLNAQSKSDAVLGKWLASDHSVAVEVYKQSGEYKAKVIWFDERLGSGKPMHTRTDFENPDPHLRKRKILGMQVLEGLEYNSARKTWENGKIYDASSGRFWDSAAHITDQGLLKVRGYWKFKWIGKSLTFKRTNNSILTKL